MRVEDKIRNCCFQKVKKKSTLCSLIELIGLFADNPPGNQSAFEPDTAVSPLLTASATAFIFVHCKFYTVRSAECSMHCKALQWAQTLCIASAWASQAYIQSSTLWIVHCLLWTQTQSCAQLASSCSAMIRIDHRVVITLAHHSQWQTRQTKRPSWAHHWPCRNIIIDITINIINTRPRFCKDGVLPPHWG